MKNKEKVQGWQNRLVIIQRFCLLVLCCILVVNLSFGQSHDSVMSIPMKNGKIIYEKEYAKAGLTRDQLYKKALQWCLDSKAQLNEDFVSAKDKGADINGNIVFKVIVSDSGHYYWIKPSFHIAINDTACMLELTDFYEKPIEPGISNEYSKLEYRWRDFRKGKPWSSEDQRLFVGIVEHISALMEKF
jgi:hypothetical protein